MWWACSGGGDRHCKDGTCNSCKSAIVECIISCEYFGAGKSDCDGGGGGGDNSGIGGVC